MVAIVLSMMMPWTQTLSWRCSCSSCSFSRWH